MGAGNLEKGMVEREREIEILLWKTLNFLYYIVRRGTLSYLAQIKGGRISVETQPRVEGKRTRERKIFQIGGSFCKFVRVETEK